MRDSFVFYRNMWEQLLEFEDTGELLLLVKGINNYAFYGKEPEFGNQMLRALWKGIKDRIDRDYKRYCDSKSKRKKEAKKENVNVNVNANENDFFEKKRERFHDEVFSCKGYPQHHLQTFFEYYSQPLQHESGDGVGGPRMLFESFRSWSLSASLAKWRPPAAAGQQGADGAVTKSKIALKTPAELAADRKAEEDAERSRVLGIVEAYRKNPGNVRQAQLVRMMQENGTLERLGVWVRG